MSSRCLLFAAALGCVTPCAVLAQWSLVGPAATLTQRGGVPDGRGNGAAVAAVGQSVSLSGGWRFQWRWLDLQFAPELHATQNEAFTTFAAGDSARSGFSSPWYFGRYSADLPSRHGSENLAMLWLGESGIWASGARWRVGATTQLPAWSAGPGESIVLGRSAAGIPRLEATWRQPTSLGELQLRWFGGAAVESRFFDQDPKNDLRGIAGARVSFARSLWQLGVSRTVMDGRRDRAPLAAALLPVARAKTDSVIEMLAADLRFTQPASGTDLWLELARQAPLRSFREFALLPSEGLAIRVGVSQALVVSDRRRWVLGFETLRMEMPPQRRDRVDQDLYTSPTVVHGWTHRGEPLGSGIGPGGQRQILSVDRERVGSSFGFFAERVRWNDDALFRQILPYPQRHDVTVQAGARAAWQSAGVQWRLSSSVGTRLSYLFQNDEWIPGYRSEDVRVFELTLALSPIGR